MKNASPAFLKLWNFQDPKQTREKFQSFLKENELSESETLQLSSQIARTHSLSGEFEEAHSVLDKIEKKVSAYPLAHIRYFLERGRTFNSENKKAEAKGNFIKAWELSLERNVDPLAIDAAHMMGIAEKDVTEQMKWSF